MPTFWVPPRRSFREILIEELRVRFEQTGKCEVCAHRTRANPAGVRRDDPDTSFQGFRDVFFRSGSYRHRLLVAYSTGAEMNSDEARSAAGLPIRSCYWKRVSELVQAGLLVWTGEVRAGDKGSDQNIYRITRRGCARLREMAQ